VALGFGKLVMLNLFAFRATDPRVMKAEPDPIGVDNDTWIVKECSLAHTVVAAWGAHGTFRGRAADVLAILARPLSCLGTTNGGQPRHPLYLPYQTPLRAFP
jgi:hypothetical protein